MTHNQARFHLALQVAYQDLFANDPEYAYSASRMTPGTLADKMLAAFLKGSGSNSGKGVARACKACSIGKTYKAIYAFLQESLDPDDVTPIAREAYCGVCGQMGCGHDGLDREDA